MAGRDAPAPRSSMEKPLARRRDRPDDVAVRVRDAQRRWQPFVCQVGVGGCADRWRCRSDRSLGRLPQDIGPQAHGWSDTPEATRSRSAELSEGPCRRAGRLRLKLDGGPPEECPRPTDLSQRRCYDPELMALPMLVSLVEAALPSSCRATMQTTAIMATRSTYSTREAPFSSRLKRHCRCVQRAARFISGFHERGGLDARV